MLITEQDECFWIFDRAKIRPSKNAFLLTLNKQKSLKKPQLGKIVSCKATKGHSGPVKAKLGHSGTLKAILDHSKHLKTIQCHFKTSQGQSEGQSTLIGGPIETNQG